MKISYSHHDKIFKKKLEGLLRSFSGNRGKILRSAFTSLPWADVNFLSCLKNKSAFKKIAVVGMGGSSLGLKALSRSLNKDDSIIFLDNVDPDFLESQLRKLKLKQTLFVLISKSGSTIEVLSISKWLIKKVGSARNFIVITDNEEAPLGRLAKRHKIPIFHSEPEVPGRFSVLSIVGLLPATLLGIYPNKLLEGARETSWPAAFTLACYQYLHFLNKKNITVLFPYCERLSTFADWYIQLLSESIGKTPRVGITPIKAIGVKDQHSILQLFLDGPDDKFYIFIKPESYDAKEEKIPGEKFSFQKLFNAEYEGVKCAFIKTKKSFVEISIPKISTQTMGSLLFLFELQIAFLGRLFKVNTETQPAVELSKKITKSLL